MGSRRQDGCREMTKFQFLRSLFLLSCVQARLVRRETSSLIEAAQHGNLDRVRRLVNDAHAPDVNELGPNDRTPLIFAASFGDPAIVQELVQAGALVDFQDNFGWSPLHWAADGTPVRCSPARRCWGEREHTGLGGLESVTLGRL